MTSSDSIVIAPSLGLSAWAGEMQGMTAPHKHHDLELNLLLRGACTYHIAGQRITVPPGRLFVLWGATPHRSCILSKDTSLIWTTVSLANVVNWNLNKRILNSLLQQGWAVDRHSHEMDEPMMRRWVAELAQSGDSAHRIVLLELEARLLRFSEPTLHGHPSQQDPEPLESNSVRERMILSIERFISDHFREAISVNDIASITGLHPNYVMSLFRKHTGLTLNKAVTKHRIAYCLHELAQTDKSILEICYDAGFGSTSRFYEAFGSEVGCSPYQYRLLARSEVQIQE